MFSSLLEHGKCSAQRTVPCRYSRGEALGVNSFTLTKSFCGGCDKESSQKETIWKFCLDLNQPELFAELQLLFRCTSQVQGLGGSVGASPAGAGGHTAQPCWLVWGGGHSRDASHAEFHVDLCSVAS